jgi:hypothetical protein
VFSRRSQSFVDQHHDDILALAFIQKRDRTCKRVADIYTSIWEGNVNSLSAGVRLFSKAILSQCRDGLDASPDLGLKSCCASAVEEALMNMGAERGVSLTSMPVSSRLLPDSPPSPLLDLLIRTVVSGRYWADKERVVNAICALAEDIAGSGRTTEACSMVQALNSMYPRLVPRKNISLVLAMLKLLRSLVNCWKVVEDSMRSELSNDIVSLVNQTARNPVVAFLIQGYVGPDLDQESRDLREISAHAREEAWANFAAAAISVIATDRTLLTELLEQFSSMLSAAGDRKSVPSLPFTVALQFAEAMLRSSRPEHVALVAERALDVVDRAVLEGHLSVSQLILGIYRTARDASPESRQVAVHRSKLLSVRVADQLQGGESVKNMAKHLLKDVDALF